MNLSDAQLTLRDGALLLAKQFGIGGDSWTVTRTSGDGITSAPSTAPIGTWSGRIKRARQATESATLPGVRVVIECWEAIGEAAVITLTAGGTGTLRPGDILTSAADSSLVFRIDGPVAVAGYARYILTARR